MGLDLAQRLTGLGLWDRMRGTLPYRLGWLLEGAALMGDLESYRAFVALRRAEGNDREPVALRVRQLGGKRIHVRAGTGDVWALVHTLLPSYHLPPAEVQRAGVHTILDLGANIGVSMTHLATRFPQARIVGVELDADNAELCRRNVAPWGARCTVVRGGVWPRDEAVAYDVEGVGPESFVARAPVDGAEAGSARGISLNTLLAEHVPDGTPVDFVKMDIEGAEREVLVENTEWAARVRAMIVEVHTPYEVAQCVRDLEALGFRARVDERYAGIDGMPPVVAVREQPAAV